MESITNPALPTIPCPEEDPAWAPGAALPGSMLPCGCHVRRPDYETILCAEHLAELNKGGTR